MPPPRSFLPVGQWVREEWRWGPVEAGAEALATRHYPGESVGEAGGSVEWETRTSKAKWAVCRAKNRRADASEVSQLVRHQLFQQC